MPDERKDLRSMQILFAEAPEDRYYDGHHACDPHGDRGSHGPGRVSELVDPTSGHASHAPIPEESEPDATRLFGSFAF